MKSIITKNDEKFLELLVSSNPSDRAKAKVAIQAFLDEPKAKQIQAFSVSTDLPRITTDTFNVNIDAANYDLGYEKVFQNVALASGTDSWELVNVANGLTFRKTEEGQRLRVEGISGTKTTAYVDKYGGALGWTDEMMRFRKIATMQTIATIFRNKFWSMKADAFYTLLVAAISSNVTSYQGVTGDGQLRRDIQTINTALYDIGNANKDSGYGDTANSRYVLFAKPNLKTRIEAAFTATIPSVQNVEGVGQIVLGNVERVYTFNSALSSTQAVLVLPGYQLQMAEAMAPTTYDDMDILSMTYTQAVWSYFGGVVGDTNQVWGVNFA